jgi:predicted peptidase
MKYSTIAKVYDLGPFIYKLILNLEETMLDCNINKETFKVHVVRKDSKTKEIIQVRKSWETEEIFPSEGERKVIHAYVSDENGNEVENGSFITLELEVDPRISLGSTIAFNGNFNVRVECDYTISQVKPITIGNIDLNNMIFDELEKVQTLLADDFITGKSNYKGINLTYAAYEPNSNGTKRPLLIWLHGAGEGGNDPIVAVSGNKVVNLISKEIQGYFNGSYVLGPQAPTMWMDDGSSSYTTNGDSMYVEALKDLIDKYIAAHDDIDIRRIYIGGCSNGGFMTMKMIISYPEMFAAAYPICEALTDCFIPDSDINRIKNIPIWFTHAANDPVVKIEIHPDATYQRLIKAGSKNVHYTRFASVIDRTGNYTNDDGSPYEYNGHFSWIPALNNECFLDVNNKPVIENGKAVSLFEWISLQINENI